MSVQVFESGVLNSSVTSVVCEDGEIYFKAKDVSTALRYENPGKAIWDHVWDENKLTLGEMSTNYRGGPKRTPFRGNASQHLHY